MAAASDPIAWIVELRSRSGRHMYHYAHNARTRYLATAKNHDPSIVRSSLTRHG
jgi:hypothetical protein